MGREGVVTFQCGTESRYETVPEKMTVRLVPRDVQGAGIADSMEPILDRWSQVCEERDERWGEALAREWLLRIIEQIQSDNEELEYQLEDLVDAVVGLQRELKDLRGW